MTTKHILSKRILEWYFNAGVSNSLNYIKKKSIKISKDVEPKKFDSPNLSDDNDLNFLLDNCFTLEDLRKLIVAQCDCGLKNTAKNLVFYDGNPSAKIMLIGEAPGAEEDKIGKPFVGDAGLLLDKMLKSIGQNRKNTYITNILYWRPPGNRKPTDEEIYACMPFVKKHIEIVNPKILILVGAIAAKAIFKSEIGITQIRGKWRNINIGRLNSLKSMAIFHPAFLLRQPSRKREAWEDLKKIKMEISQYT